MPDVDDFDPNADQGASNIFDKKPADELPLPPDVKDREPIGEPEPESPPVEDPRDPPKQIV
jgi:hypothetical protein